MTRHLLTPVVFICCLAIGWYLYNNVPNEAAENTGAPGENLLAVNVVSVQTRKISNEISLVGSLEAVAEVVIRSPDRGHITGLLHDVGDPVRGPLDDSNSVPAGEIVITLDDELHREKILAANAALTVQKADLLAQQARRKLAKTTLERRESTLASGAFTQQEVEEARAQLEIAEAELQLVTARVDEVQSSFDQSQIALTKRALATPISGYIAERFVDVGDLANPDDPLLRIVKIDPIRIMVHVAEEYYPNVKTEQQATVEVDALPDRSFIGKVVRKAPVLDPTTRTSKVYLEIANPDRSLKPGMHARVELVLEKRESATVVPVAALLQGDDRPFVYVVQGDPPRAELRHVRVGLMTSQVVEILNGVKNGEQVITLGSRLVEDGQEIAPVSTSNSDTLATSK